MVPLTVTPRHLEQSHMSISFPAPSTRTCAFASLSLWLVSACLAPNDAPDLGEHTEDLTRVQPLSRNLDEPVPPASGLFEIDMQPGRINKVPVSTFYQGTINPTFAHSLRLRTVGCTGLADTAIIATWSEGKAPFATFFTGFANDGQPGGNGRCSFLDLGSQPSGRTYSVYVVSMTRATSFATLQVSTDGGTTWTDKVTDNFGGTVVRVGPLQPGDFVEVQTASNGQATIDLPFPLPPIPGQEGTRMLLFAAPPAGTPFHARAAMFSDGASASDADPFIQVGAGWTSGNNLAVLGKDTRSTGSMRAVETSVDLVRGPVDQVATAPSMTCAGATCTSGPVVFPPGRYSIALSARGVPVGDARPGTPSHPASEVGGFTVDGDQVSCPATARGQGNSLAFVARILRNGVIVESRTVPRGLLGGDPVTGPSSSVLFDAEGDGAATFTVEVVLKAPDVTIASSALTLRNRRANEIKVASWNFAYWADADEPSKRSASVRNAVDVLATRGEIVPSTMTVNERLDQAPWQWDADVVMFQEFFSDTNVGVTQRLAERSPFSWSMVNANTEIRDTVSDAVKYGPIFASNLVQPPEGIKYSTAQLTQGTGARCDSRWEGGGRDFACPLGTQDFTTYNFSNGAVPAKIVARRQVGTGTTDGDRPIALFNWHLYYPDTAFAERVGNVTSMIERMKYLMAQPADGAFPAGGCAFNKDCSSSPSNANNRMIIVGDSNMANNKCGEYTWALRMLRQEFGYAIDASSAAVDATGRTFDLHYSGASLLDLRTGTFGNCQDPNWAKTPYNNGTASGCPFHFQNVNHWNANPDFSLSSWHPWWASSFGDIHGSDSLTERYDVVFLVGRGWAQDDPVMTYKVLPNRQEASPANGGAGGGVEIHFADSCAGKVTDSPVDPLTIRNYAPMTAFGSCGMNPGAPALHSDHIPIGVRLRVTN